jgi:hypothetical protein
MEVNVLGPSPRESAPVLFSPLLIVIVNPGRQKGAEDMATRGGAKCSFSSACPLKPSRLLDLLGCAPLNALPLVPVVWRLRSHVQLPIGCNACSVGWGLASLKGAQ